MALAWASESLLDNSSDRASCLARDISLFDLLVRQPSGEELGSEDTCLYLHLASGQVYSCFRQ